MRRWGLRSKRSSLQVKDEPLSLIHRLESDDEEEKVPTHSTQSNPGRPTHPLPLFRLVDEIPSPLTCSEFAGWDLWLRIWVKLELETINPKSKILNPKP
jgi:hypothetical protein